MTITLQEGRFYRTASGVKVGPMKKLGATLFEGHGLGFIISGGRSKELQKYHPNGSVYQPQGGEEQDHIVALWEDPSPEPSPIKMKPVLVPGTYGRIQIETCRQENFVNVRFEDNENWNSLSETDCHSLAMTFSHLAEFIGRKEDD